MRANPCIYCNTFLHCFLNAHIIWLGECQHCDYCFNISITSKSIIDSSSSRKRIGRGSERGRRETEDVHLFSLQQQYDYVRFKLRCHWHWHFHCDSRCRWVWFSLCFRIIILFMLFGWVSASALVAASPARASVCLCVWNTSNLYIIYRVIEYVHSWVCVRTCVRICCFRLS